MLDYYEQLLQIISDFKTFLNELLGYLIRHLHISFLGFEEKKSVFAAVLYRQRGRMSRKLMHTGMAGLAAAGMMLAPFIAKEFPGRSLNPWELATTTSVLSAQTEDPLMQTLISDKVRDKVIEYTVLEGDTISSIAEKFGISEDTVRWQNDLKNDPVIKVGQIIQVLPVTGVSHKVQKGDTVYSIAKQYDTSPQGIVDFPYNTFMNDETFDLAIGQIIIIPEGVKPEARPGAPARIRQITPDAGTVVASGIFVWPASGSITQNFVWYHKGVDIANKAGPNVLAADSGRVVIAGWPDGTGYGNRVIIDHGNGYKTLYAHLSSIYVVPGQSVVRSGAIGRMGSSGRSTGTHLHFEVIQNGVYLNPLNVLR